MGPPPRPPPPPPRWASAGEAASTSSPARSAPRSTSARATIAPTLARRAGPALQSAPMIVRTEHLDLATPTGVMRTHVYAPAAPAGHKRYPGLLLYPEIYQQTGPIARLCAQFAAHGYVVMAPEIYHEHEPPGTVLAYDAAGTDKGNAYKWSTKLSTWDADVDVVVRALEAHAGCNGRVGAVGFCIGGHLAL